MKLTTLRFVVLALLFAAWIGWLVYLVVELNSSVPSGATRPVILSRPQFLVSSLDVIAEVHDFTAEPAEVTVREVAWPKDKETQDLVGKQLKVSHLSECREDWLGPGEYILALMRLGEHGYQVVPLPRSPGFPAGRRRIYPATPQTRQQLQEIESHKAAPLLLSEQGE
jgi:hypothetical protein